MLVFACSFGEHGGISYNPPHYGITYGYSNAFWIQTTGARTGGHCLVIPALSPHDDRKCCISNFTALNEAYIQLAMATSTARASDSNYWLSIYNGTSIMLSFQWATSDGCINVYRGDFKGAGVWLGQTSDSVRTDGVYAVYEFNIKLDSSVGKVRIRKDGVTFLNFTGNTQIGKRKFPI